MALLVSAAWELRGNPEPSLAAHLIDAGEQLIVLLLRPRLWVLWLGLAARFATPLLLSAEDDTLSSCTLLSSRTFRAFHLDGFDHV